MWKSPGSAEKVYAPSAPNVMPSARCQYAKSFSEMWKCTVRDSPAGILTRWNPLSSRIGRVNEPTKSRIYNCGTATASRLPVLVIVQEAVRLLGNEAMRMVSDNTTGL